MIDTTIKAYATRQLGLLALAAALAGSLFVAAGSNARTVTSPQAPAVAAPSSAVWASFSGVARVVDGDTIAVGDLRVRLEGIDAPEASQTCLTRLGQPWPCGTKATNELARLVDGRQVRCEDRGLDKYNRTLGICFLGSLDINAEMVRRGFAWAFVKYSNAYVAVEAEARAAKAGIWEGDATPAWDFRAGRWQTAEIKAPEGCAIKGNVTANGRIYHMPWSPWYEKVRMDDLSKGKRWFCSETEAVAAGWRPAQTH